MISRPPLALASLLAVSALGAGGTFAGGDPSRLLHLAPRALAAAGETTRGALSAPPVLDGALVAVLSLYRGIADQVSVQVRKASTLAVQEATPEAPAGPLPAPSPPGAASPGATSPGATSGSPPAPSATTAESPSPGASASAVATGGGGGGGPVLSAGSSAGTSPPDTTTGTGSTTTGTTATTGTGSTTTGTTGTTGTTTGTGSTTTTTTGTTGTTTTTTGTTGTTTTTTGTTGTTGTTTTSGATSPSGFSASQLIFSDNFSGTSLDPTKWSTYMTSRAANGWPWMSGPGGGSALGSAYLDYDEPSAVSVNGGLNLTATPGSSTSGFSWTSGVVTTYGHFQFDGGYVQAVAKLPTANGDWPAIWMLPGPGASTTTDNFEVDLVEAGMTAGFPAAQNLSYHLHEQPSQWGGNFNTGVDLSSGFHTYGLDWVPGQSITWYFDGQQVAQVTSAQFPIPNEPMELIINNGMANAQTSGWHTQVDGTTGSSSDLVVRSIQVYQ